MQRGCTIGYVPLLAQLAFANLYPWTVITCADKLRLTAIPTPKVYIRT
jgi:hypothetical protein